MSINETVDPLIPPRFKVSLKSATGKHVVIFDVTPTISEERSIEYDSLNIVHMPGNILTYKNTSSRTFGLSDIKFISRTPKEARKNMIRLNILRAWAMPYFGVPGRAANNAAVQSAQAGSINPEARLFAIQQARNDFLSFLGAPPDVLYLSAYAGQDGNNPFEGNINSVSVVLTNLGIAYPNDVDYIPCGKSQAGNDNIGGTPFPTVMTITISLKEIHSPREFQNFSIDDFRRGNLSRF